MQDNIIEQFDKEFKLWIHQNGYNIDNSLFEIKFTPPQNFAAYRQAELDTTRANLYGAVAENPYLSKRFAMKRFLGLTEEEITENETLWREENGMSPNVNDPDAELRGIGVSQSGITADLDMQDAEISPGAEGSTDATTATDAQTAEPAPEE